MPHDDFNWVVLIGGYSGDGSKDHKLFRLSGDDDRVPFFNSHAAAEDYALAHIHRGAAAIAKITPSSPAPPPDRDAFGRFNTGTVRVRPGLFGIAVCEELYEHLDGSREWRRSQTAIVISERKE